MEIHLPDELEEYVKAKVENGDYSWPSAVVVAALYLLRESEKSPEQRIGDLRRDLQAGLDELERGEGEPWDVEELKAEILAKSKRAG